MRSRSNGEGARALEREEETSKAERGFCNYCKWGFFTFFLSHSFFFTFWLNMHRKTLSVQIKRISYRRERGPRGDMKDVLRHPLCPLEPRVPQNGCDNDKSIVRFATLYNRNS